MNIYSLMISKLKGFNENYNDCVWELERAISKLKSSLVVNNNEYITGEISGVINDIRRDINFINDYIIPDAQNR